MCAREWEAILERRGVGGEEEEPGRTDLDVVTDLGVAIIDKVLNSKGNLMLVHDIVLVAALKIGLRNGVGRDGGFELVADCA
jgi:hypothetical protein